MLLCTVNDGIERDVAVVLESRFAIFDTEISYRCLDTRLLDTRVRSKV